jgi:hypothetical protein
MAFPIVTPAELIGQLYVGYFGRAADPVGLDYWVNRFNDGMSLLAIANSFAVQPEATSLYDYLAAPSLGDPVAFITAIYHDLFNRDPDSPGLAYWVHQLTVQGTPPGQMVLDVISGAQGADITTIQNKTHAAVEYARSFVDDNVAWDQIDDIAGARAAVAFVTDDPATVVTAGLTAYAISSGYQVWFQSGLITNAVDGITGSFAHLVAVNPLNLTADDTTTRIIGSYDDVTVVGKSGGVGIGETVWLVHDPEITTGVIGVDLRAVEGPTAVYNTGGTQSLSIIGGVGTTNILIGGSAADTIVAKGNGPGFGANFIWGGLGGDIETGVAGGAAGDVGTVFLINDRAESPGNGPDGTVLHITNFRGGADTLLINPAALALGDFPVFIGDAVDYGNALALLAGGFAERTQAVYQLDDQALWIDVDNNGLLNALDIKAFVDFSGPGFLPGALDFGNLLGLFDGRQATTYIEARLAPPASGGTVDLVGVIPGVGADSLVGSS